MIDSFIVKATDVAKVDGKLGPGEARSILTGDRFTELERRFSYFDCTQHDRKYWDFDGRPINPKSMTPLISAERAWWVPLSQRRPSTPVRLGRVIVQSFTNLLFGENRFPTIRVEGDDLSEDWIQTAARTGKLSSALLKARGYGGASGTAGISWYFRDGKPYFEAHKPQNLFVHSWADRNMLIPEHVSEVYLTSKIKWDGKGFNRIYYWFRRDWTPDADIGFKQVPYDKDRDPVFIVDEENTVRHDDGVCHLEWIQNLPTDEIDGLPDYDGLYENFDSIDLIMSVITRGAIRNLDPTVKLKMDPGLVAHGGIKKGSDNALIVGLDGDAEYMEIGGQSIEAGTKLVEAMRRQILETAQCIIPDPNEVAAQGVSSLAIKAMFGPMTAKTDVLREQYGGAEERILGNMASVAREKTAMQIVVPGEVAEVIPTPTVDAILDPSIPHPADPPPDDGDNADPLAVTPSGGLDESVPDIPDVPAQFVFELPPKIVQEPMIDPLTGMPDPSGQTIAKRIPRELGPGGEVSLEWPPYFAATYDDQAKVVTALQTATGGKAFISAETATKNAAKVFGVDPTEEWRRVTEEDQAAQAQQASMLDMGAVGGAVDHPTAPPPGAEHTDPVPPHPKASEDPVPPHPNADPDALVPVDVDLTHLKA